MRPSFQRPLFCVRTAFTPLRAGFTLVEVMVAAAISGLAIGVIITSLMQCMRMARWQSAYETAYSYAEQGLEYALYVPYTDFALTAYTSPSVNWVSNGFLYSVATGTNFINTTDNYGTARVMTNITYLATQQTLPLDDLGSIVLERDVLVQDRTVVEPAGTNSSYKLIIASNTWTFLGRAMPPIIIQTIRDAP